MGVAVSVSVYVHLQLFEPFLGRHSEFLLFVDDQQALVPKYHFLAEQTVSTDQNIRFP